MKVEKTMKARILVAEDEGLVATDVKMTLESYGYEVCSIASTGEEALLKCEGERPDLVLMDIMLAGQMDGIEAADRIKGLYDIPVVYLTAYSDEVLLKRAKKTEPFGYLVKPFGDRELYSTIEMAIHNHSIAMKLRESDAWLQTTLRSIGDGIIATDTDGNIKLMNPVAQELTGWSEDDASGRPLAEILRPLNEETGEEDSLFLGKVLREGRPAGISTHILRRNGDRIFIADSAAPIVDSNNRTLGMVLTFSDMTEKKRLDEKMRQGEERYRLLFNHLPYGGEVLDKEGFIVDCSAKNAELLGYERAEMLGKHITEFLSPESRPVFQEKFPLLKQGKTVQAVVSMVRKDNRLIDIERTASPLFDAEGKFSGVLALNVDITERKKMEKELLKYEHIVSSSSEHMSFIDRNYVYQAVNDQYLKAFQKKRGEIIGHSVADLFTQEVFEGFVKERLDRCLGGERINYEAWFNFPALGRRYMDVRYYPFSDIKGIVAGAVVVARDVTERKLMEDALHESEETLRGIFDSSHDGILVADVETRRFHLGNNRICKMLGYSLEELKELGVEDIHPEEDIPNIVEQFRKMANEKISLVEKVRVRRKDKSIFFADIGSSNVQIKGRTYSMGMFRDVTERRQIERSLQKSEEKYRALLANINEIVYVVRSENENSMTGQVEFVSDKATEITGFHPSEFMARNELWFQLVHPDDVPSVIESTRTLFSNKHSVTRTYRLRKKGTDEYLWIEDNMAPRFDETGRMTGFFGVARDITERKRFEEHLKKYSSDLEAKVHERTEELEEKTIQADAANRSKTEFLANMSHELRTPLNAVIGFSDLLLSGVAGALTDEQNDHLKNIWESGKHLNRIINDILDMTKIETDSVELQLGEFPLKDSIDEVLGLFSRKAEREGIKISADIPDDIGHIIADEQKIRQVIQNLLGNAFKFTPTGGSVRVAARKVRSSGLGVGSEKENKFSGLITQHSELDGDFIEISVADTGIGIAKEDIDRLFQPFQQLSPALTKKYEGVGLGLSICRKNVDLHGGKLWVEGGAGKGGRFIFIVPVSKGL